MTGSHVMDLADLFAGRREVEFEFNGRPLIAVYNPHGVKLQDVTEATRIAQMAQILANVMIELVAKDPETEERTPIVSGGQPLEFSVKAIAGWSFDFVMAIFQAVSSDLYGSGKDTPSDGSDRPKRRSGSGSEGS